MNRLRYTQKQIDELLKNRYVKNCTFSSIIYTKECKIKVLEMLGDGLFYKDIFKTLGFPEYVVNSRIPELCSNRWKRNIKYKGKVEVKKGRKKREKIDIHKMSKDEYIEYLEAKLALVEELKKLDDGKYP